MHTTRLALFAALFLALTASIAFATSHETPSESPSATPAGTKVIESDATPQATASVQEEAASATPTIEVIRAPGEVPILPDDFRFGLFVRPWEEIRLIKANFPGIGNPAEVAIIRAEIGAERVRAARYAAENKPAFVKELLEDANNHFGKSELALTRTQGEEIPLEYKQAAEYVAEKSFIVQKDLAEIEISPNTPEQYRESVKILASQTDLASNKLVENSVKLVDPQKATEIRQEYVDTSTFIAEKYIKAAKEDPKNAAKYVAAYAGEMEQAGRQFEAFREHAQTTGVNQAVIQAFQEQFAKTNFVNGETFSQIRPQDAAQREAFERAGAKIGNVAAQATRGFSEEQRRDIAQGAFRELEARGVPPSESFRQQAEAFAQNPRDFAGNTPNTQGNQQFNDRNFPGNVPFNEGQFPGNTPGNVPGRTGEFPGNAQGNFPGNAIGNAPANAIGISPARVIGGAVGDAIGANRRDFPGKAIDNIPPAGTQPFTPPSDQSGTQPTSAGTPGTFTQQPGSTTFPGTQPFTPPANEPAPASSAPGFVPSTSAPITPPASTQPASGAPQAPAAPPSAPPAPAPAAPPSAPPSGGGTPPSGP